MKYQSSNTKQLFNVEFTSKNSICPECSHLRKKKKDKCLQYYSDTNSAYCFNCNTTFFEYKPYSDEKQYKVPEWKNITKLTDKSVKWFTGRMISQDTLNKMKIYSDNEYMPKYGKEIEVMCFPYFLNGKLKNIKFRGAEKSFKLYSGAELIFYNIDQLKDAESIIIVEGEIDCLTFIENGYENVISVPNGANKNIEYLDNYIDLFEPINKIYVSTDNDTKGIILRDELIRRLGVEKCLIVSYKECKDANDYFMKYGGIEFKELLNNAKEPPVKGVVTCNSIQNEIYDFFNNGFQKGLEINQNNIDEFITWQLGRIAIVTGIPGSGKSEFVDYVVSKLNLLYGWRAAFFTPENYPLKYHYQKVYEKLIGKEFNAKKSNEIEYDMAYEHIKDNFFWILNEESLTIDSILQDAKFLIKAKGIKILVIDPFNKIDHQYSNGMSETQYISKFLDKLIMFGKLNNILIFLVAHPTKMQKGDIPTLYNISGSAHFYNKTDYGFTTHRKFDDQNIMTNDIEVHWQKIKFKNLGKQGVSELRYNYNNGRFESVDKDVNSWDNSNWLFKKPNNEIKEVEFFNELAEKDTENDLPF